MLTPDFVASRKPSSFNLSSITTVFSWPANFVTLPDHVAEFGFLDRLVRETQFVRPDFAENDAANGRLDDFLSAFSENSRLAKIRIRQADAVVRFQTARRRRQIETSPSSRTTANLLKFAGAALRGSAVT